MRDGPAGAPASRPHPGLLLLLLLLLLLGGLLRALGLARLEFRLVFVVRHVVPADPREAHLVDGALTVADPVLGIGVRLVRLGVVVPGDDVENRPRRDERR